MKIERIVKTKNSNYELLFSDDSKLLVNDEVLLKHKLLYDKEISNELLEQIKEDNHFYEVYNEIVKMIRRRIRSEYEIKVYMNEKDIPLTLRLKILEKLQDTNLIDDYNYALSYTHDKFNFNHYGPKKIANNLEELCINSEYIKLAIATINYDDILKYIRTYIDKKIKLNKKDSEYVFKQKIINYLLNQGYYKEDIYTVLGEYTFKMDNVLDNEYKRIYKSLENKYSGSGLEKQIREKLFKRGFTKEEINMYYENKKYQ